VAVESTTLVLSCAPLVTLGWLSSGGEGLYLLLLHKLLLCKQMTTDAACMCAASI